MARIKLTLPEKFSFQCTIPVRITDINYGGHAGNDSVLSIIHEARMQFLSSKNYTEMEVDGVSLIMGDVAIEFKSEIFYGDVLTAFVKATDPTKAGFDLYYKILNQEGKLIVTAKTGMICFDYSKRKIVALPETAKEKLSD